MVDIRKKWLVGLSFVSCIICTIILLTSSTPEVHTLYSLSEIDEVLSQELGKFDDEHIITIQTSEVNVDSLLTRKHYRIDVSDEFKSTFFHINMARHLHQKGVSIHGIRIFPERTLELSFIFGGKLVRTAEIRINPSSSTDSIDI